MWIVNNTRRRSSLYYRASIPPPGKGQFGDPFVMRPFVKILRPLVCNRQRAEAVEPGVLQRIRESLSVRSVASIDVPEQPSTTTSNAARLHQRRARDLATADLPAQPSATKQARAALSALSRFPPFPHSSIPFSPRLFSRSLSPALSSRSFVYIPTVSTAGIVYGADSMHLSGVRPSVRLSIYLSQHRPQLQTAAVTQPAGDID